MRINKWVDYVESVAPDLLRSIVFFINISNLVIVQCSYFAKLS